MDIARIYGVPIRVEKFLPSGTILPDPNALITYPPDWPEMDLYEKLRWVARQGVMLYVSQDVVDAIRNDALPYTEIPKFESEADRQDYYRGDLRSNRLRRSST